MTRIGKKEERRNRSPRKHKAPSVKTGPKEDNLPVGYKPHENALGSKANAFIAKVK
ncbi:MAG: hypothetical protein S4CHLAM81_00020 [Chlamydiales bacterium]|nr:hypothetical protein [Chlamydiales bacterium]MCH9634806.1 hypothetical protein [Chlamydiales bacterium]MCH9704133.1 hypothetical protein [Chlamydiota bacterium]